MTGRGGEFQTFGPNHPHVAVSLNGLGELYTLGLCRRDLSDFSAHCGSVRRARFRVLRVHDGAAIGLGSVCHARDQGRALGGNSEEAGH